ncbi:adenine specific DNA methylase Mod (plasmid) [Lacticaseibacillus paracasei]|nr:adenine specific DNA methylase Mod [Lacticaseibacillus paracasei]AEA58668.1 adenine specific DNA methylase [Lacticaseibacillus paracasei]PAK81122.1 DNA methyltransferase [Lentilactobacillus kefiri]PAL05362.1 DNA methyltransferase [Lentilactobacillus kefiri]
MVPMAIRSIESNSLRTCLVSAESGRIVENRLRSLSCQIIQAIFLERNLR